MSITKIVRTLRPAEDFAREAGTVPVPLAPSGGPAPESASLVTKFGRLRRELAVWRQGGAKFAPSAVRKARAVICSTCLYYHGDGNLGLGECRYPGCGCTRAKLWLATSVCPHKPSKWPAYRPSGGP